MKARALFATALFGVVGCDLVIGLHDVPIPGEGGVDAAFDSIVVPDGPFEGCNGGAEDCANGIDDNCNGLVDCADPVCQGASYRCVAPPPAGWSELSAFAAATGSAFPTACSGAYATLGAQGHDGLSVAAAQCGCACSSSQAIGTACGAVDVQGFSGTGCTAPDEKITVSAGSCSPFTNPQQSLEITVHPPTTLGSCGTPNATKTIPTPAWAHTYVACTYSAPANGGGCNASERCVEMPSSAYEAKPCVFHAGDVPCPSTDYTEKTLMTTATSDTRDCSACSCTASGGACAATLVGNTGATCNGVTVAVSTNGTCTAPGDSTLSIAFTSSNVTPATCSASTSAPTGAFTETTPVTVCCAP